MKPGAFDYLLDDIDRERRVRLDDLVHDNQPPRPPPIPPRHDPPRRIEIVIDLRPEPPKPRKRRWPMIVAVIFGLIFLGTFAKGQTPDNGQPTTVTSRQQGFVTYTETTQPDGRVVRCSSYREGFNTIIRCD